MNMRRKKPAFWFFDSFKYLFDISRRVLYRKKKKLCTKHTKHFSETDNALFQKCLNSALQNICP